MKFTDYVLHGWALCRIHEGEKRPRGDGWNTVERAITDLSVAEHMVNGGLQHAFSGTCAIDIDNFDLARSWLKERGIDLNELFNADDAVQIVSGDAQRGKLIYALPSIDDRLSDHAKRWPTKQIKNDDKTLMILELRCGATTGNSAQDVLPPSTNPRTGKQYQWKYNNELVGSWNALPPLPESLRALWMSMIVPTVERTAADYVPTAELDELAKLLARYDPDVAEPEWWRLGAIVAHETGHSDAGYALFDAWSSKGAKYEGPDATRLKWEQIASRGDVANPATAGSLRREAVASDDDFGPALDQDLLAEAERATRVTFDLVPLTQFALREPVRYLVEDLIEVGQLFGFIGKRKGGKSYAALDLAFAVAQGREWAKHKVNETGFVVWIAAEGARSLQIRRGPQWLAHYGDADIRVWPRGLNMRSADTYAGLVEACQGAKLVVIDSLRRVTPGAKENSSDELVEVLAYAEQLTRETGAAVCFIAHAGKAKAEGDDMTARGSSVIEDQLEAGFFIEKLEDDNAGKFRVTPGFARDEETGDDAALIFGLKEITPEGLEPGVIVNWDVDQSVAKPKREAARTSATDTLAIKVLDGLWPVDGEPVIGLDAFFGKYADNLPKPDGEDTRITKALTALSALTKKGVVEIDNAKRTITLLQSAAFTHARSIDAILSGDPDEDLL